MLFYVFVASILVFAAVAVILARPPWRKVGEQRGEYIAVEDRERIVTMVGQGGYGAGGCGSHGPTSGSGLVVIPWNGATDVNDEPQRPDQG